MGQPRHAMPVKCRDKRQRAGQPGNPRMTLMGYAVIIEPVGHFDVPVLIQNPW